MQEYKENIDFILNKFHEKFGKLEIDNWSDPNFDVLFDFIKDNYPQDLLFDSEEALEARGKFDTIIIAELLKFGCLNINLN